MEMVLPSRPLARRALVYAAAAALMLLLGAIVARALGLYGGQIDLRVYRMGGSVLLDGGDLYQAELPGSGLPFTYPPFAAVIMTPLAIMPWWLAVTAWAAISVVCLGLVWRSSLTSAERIRLAERLHLPPVALLAALAVASIALEPVRETLSFGQINLLLTAIILIDLTADDRRRWRGGLLGIAIGLKLTPVIFIGYLVVTRQWRVVRNTLLGLAVTIGIGFAAAPGDSWHYWTKVVRDAERVGGLAFTANQSVMGFVSRILGDSGAVRPWWFGLSVIFSLVALWLAYQLDNRGERLAAVSVTALAGLFASPVSWSHHWIWVIPLGVVVIRAAARRTASRALPAVVGLAWFGLFTLGLIWWVPYRGDRELDWTFWQSLPGNSYLIAGVAALAYLGWTLRNGTGSPPEPVRRGHQAAR